MTQILVKTSNGTWYSADILNGSSFALEINQPLLDTEHIPVPFSTDIPLPPTKKNKEIFAYIPVLMSEPGVKELEAAIVVDGITLAKGIITYTGIDSGNLQYAFSGKNVEDEWQRKIWDPTDSLVNKVVAAAAVDRYYRPYSSGYVRFPTILDKKYEQTPWGLYNNTERAYNRYYNWNPEIGNMVFERGLPVVYLGPIIKQGAASLSLGSEITSLLGYLGICGKYGTFRQERVQGYNMLTVPGLVKSKVFGSLPDVSIARIIKDLLKLTCSSLFRIGNTYEVKSAASCLTSEAVDIAGKVSDIYSAAVETGKRYVFSYQNAQAGEDDLTESPTDYQNLKALLDSVLESGRDLGDLKTVRHSVLKDIYSLCGARYGYTNGAMTAGSLKSRYLGKLDSDPDNEESFENSVESTPITCQPDYVPIREIESGGTLETSTPRMIPVMEAPSPDGERGTDVLIGIVNGYQMCDKGRMISQTSPEDLNLGVSLAIDSLYGNYHSEFASWVSADKQTVRADLDFNALDVANIQMHRRVRFAGRRWLIKKISVTITAGGRLKTEGEFVSA